MVAPVRYIECDDLASLLLTPESSQLAVVDVRDEDFEGGHIKGAVNWPSSSFNDDDGIDRLIGSALEGKEKVVVHCMFSQQRGPRSALRLAQRLEQVNRQDVTVLVLRGGFRRFLAIYGSDPTLCEDVGS